MVHKRKTKKVKPIYATVNSGGKQYEFKFANLTLAQQFVNGLKQHTPLTIGAMLTTAATYNGIPQF